MAKLTALQIVNNILKNIGEAGDLSALTSLTSIQQLCFDKANESIIELAGLAKWMPLEAQGTSTMLTSTSTYTPPTDMAEENIDTFRLPDYNGVALRYYKTPAEWDSDYPKGITTERTGWPSGIMRFNNTFYLNTIPLAAQNTKRITFRYWQLATKLTTATATGTCWIPEGMDDLVLVNLATYKVLAYKGNPEAMDYYNRVFGRGQNDKGYLEQMKKLYSSPRVRMEIFVTARMENNRGGRATVFDRLVR